MSTEKKGRTKKIQKEKNEKKALGVIDLNSFSGKRGRKQFTHAL